MDAINLSDLFIWFVAFLLSFTAHEAAHAWIAMKGGDLTAYAGGQVTLNPLPHIERSPVGMVVVPLVSYALGGWMIGWASAPYDPNWAAQYPRRAAWMAAAGPAANFVIMIVAFTLLKAGLAFGYFAEPLREQLFANDRLQLGSVVIATAGGMSGIAKLLSILFMLNIILLLFNLLPFPPLDGSSVVTLFMSEQIAQRFTGFVGQPMYSFLGIVVAWKILNFLFWDVFVICFRLLHGPVF